ncbi:MAG: peroxidase family protein [Planctomycetaceae bacterium]
MLLRKKRRQSKIHNAAQIEAIEDRVLLSASNTSGEVASIDGSGNNLENENWGSAHIALERAVAVEYGDGVSTLAGEDRPSAREVSNAIAAVDELQSNDRYLTDILWIWGQFIDHDLDLSEGGTGGEANIEVPTGDVFFDPFGTGEAVIDFTRTGGEFDEDGVLQQVNAITAFLDGSVVYGSDDDRAAAIRTFEGGLLKTSDGDLLPYNVDGYDNAGGTSDTLYLAGDSRANENIALASMHTVFVREHNRIATDLAEENPDLTDDELYQEARSIVRAQLQSITFNEYLPALLGTNAISEYDGYDSNVNPNISNLFSTAAYRFGHTLLSPELLRLDADGNVADEGNIALQNAFFRPDELATNGIDSILRGATVQVAQELDNEVVDDVRNFLFGPPGAGGFDLVSLNIQRGRDHGLADYNQARLDLGLEAAESFSDITSDPDVAAKLEQLYGTVDNIDVWVGGLAEDHLPGSSMGETFTTVLVDQFERLRDGDRFWYQNVMSRDQVREIEDTTLADIIERNTGIEGLQDNIFFAPSVVHVDISDLRTDEVTVRERSGNIEVVDDRSQTVVTTLPAENVERVMLIGDGDRGNRVSIKAIPSEALPGGIVVEFNSTRGDTLAIEGTRAPDAINLDDTSADLNGLSIQHFGTDRAVVNAGRGGDTVDATDATIAVHIFGETGADRLFGGRGNDMIDGGGGNDRIDGRAGNDRLMGQAGNDLMMGRGGRDMLDGGAGNDRLRGGGSADQLIGGQGNDNLRGGGGANRFELSRNAGDTIGAFLSVDVRDELNLSRRARDAVFTTDELNEMFA